MTPICECPSAPSPVAGREYAPGDLLGCYRLGRLLGEGGCGRVFLAEQLEPVRRRVALKVIKFGMDTRETIVRFELERQALTLMEHPHIAGVLDAGTTESGRPYFVMDLVDGPRITDYCDRERLPLAARLALFAEVCHAIQYAHLKGVIHRDIKPGNVLVAVHDGVAHPRIIDFGLATAVSPAREPEAGARPPESGAGTPGYMSPEQADTEAAAIDTRTDIYSLGALLRELLRGMVARGRELDWIVARCLESEPAQRYPTALALAEDVERCLRHEPVEARPHGLWYVGGKFARRHWPLAAAAAAIVVLLVTASAAGISAAWRARRAEKTAAADATAVRAVQAFIEKDLLGAIRHSAGPPANVTLRMALERADHDITARFGHRPAVELGIRTALAVTYQELGDYDRTFTHRSRILALRRQELGDEAPATLEALADYARAANSMGRFALAEVAARRVIATGTRTAGLDARGVRAMTDVLVHALNGRGRHAQARALAADNLRRVEQSLPPEDPLQPTVARTLAMLLLEEKNFGEAERIIDRIIAAELQRHGRDTSMSRIARNMRGMIYHSQRRFADAIAVHRENLGLTERALGPEHPSTLTVLNNLARAQLEGGESAAALEILGRVIEAKTRLLGPDHPSTLRSRMVQGLGLRQVRRVAEAAEVQADVRERCLAVFGQVHPDTLQITAQLAITRRVQGRPAEAETLLNVVVAAQKEGVESATMSFRAVLDELGRSLLAQDRAAEALPHLREAARQRASFSDPPRAQAETTALLGEALLRAGQWTEAATTLRHAQAGWRELADQGVAAAPARLQRVQGWLAQAQNVIAASEHAMDVHAAIHLGPGGN